MAEIKYSVVMGEIITWEPTNCLQWREPIHGNKNIKILEQKWINRSTGATEWREVVTQ